MSSSTSSSGMESNETSSTSENMEQERVIVAASCTKTGTEAASHGDPSKDPLTPAILLEMQKEIMKELNTGERNDTTLLGVSMAELLSAHIDRKLAQTDPPTSTSTTTTAMTHNTSDEASSSMDSDETSDMDESCSLASFDYGDAASYPETLLSSYATTSQSWLSPQRLATSGQRGPVDATQYGHSTTGSLVNEGDRRNNLAPRRLFSGRPRQETTTNISSPPDQEWLERYIRAIWECARRPRLTNIPWERMSLPRFRWRATVGAILHAAFVFRDMCLWTGSTTMPRRLEMLESRWGTTALALRYPIYRHCLAYGDFASYQSLGSRMERIETRKRDLKAVVTTSRDTFASTTLNRPNQTLQLLQVAVVVAYCAWKTLPSEASHTHMADSPSVTTMTKDHKPRKPKKRARRETPAPDKVNQAPGSIEDRVRESKIRVKEVSLLERFGLLKDDADHKPSVTPRKSGKETTNGPPLRCGSPSTLNKTLKRKLQPTNLGANKKIHSDHQQDLTSLKSVDETKVSSENLVSPRCTESDEVKSTKAATEDRKGSSLTNGMVDQGLTKDPPTCLPTFPVPGFDDENDGSVQVLHEGETSSSTASNKDIENNVALEGAKKSKKRKIPLVYDETELSDRARMMLQALEDGRDLSSIHRTPEARKGHTREITSEPTRPVSKLSKKLKRSSKSEEKRQRKEEKRKRKREKKRMKELSRLHDSVGVVSHSTDDGVITPHQSPVTSSNSRLKKPPTKAQSMVPSKKLQVEPPAMESSPKTVQPQLQHRELEHFESRRAKSTENNPTMPRIVNLLCSEAFIEAWGDLAATLAAGVVNKTTSPNSNGTGGLHPRVCFVDTVLIDQVEVDLEISRAHAAIVTSLSKLEAVELLDRSIRVISLSKYEILDIIVCVDTDLSQYGQAIVELQSSLLGPKVTRTAVSIRLVSPNSIAEVIATTIYNALSSHPADDTTNFQDVVTNDKIRERLIFLLALIPSLSVTEAVSTMERCMNADPVAQSKPWLQQLILPVAHSRTGTPCPSLGPNAFQQLHFAAKTSLWSDRGASHYN